MQGVPLTQRIEEFSTWLDMANGLGMTVSDIAKRAELSKHRVRQILDTMKSRNAVVEADVVGSYHHFGLKLYFSPHHFKRVAGFKPDCAVLYRLRQTTIFELIGEGQ